jgi:hypothetical protein
MIKHLWTRKKQTPPQKPPRPIPRWLRALRVCLPRIDVLILLFGLACTIWGKLVLVGTYKPANYLPEMVVIAPDVLFFAAVALFIRFFYIL